MSSSSCKLAGGAAACFDTRCSNVRSCAATLLKSCPPGCPLARNRLPGYVSPFTASLAADSCTLHVSDAPPTALPEPRRRPPTAPPGNERWRQFSSDPFLTTSFGCQQDPWRSSLRDGKDFGCGYAREWKPCGTKTSCPNSRGEFAARGTPDREWASCSSKTVAGASNCGEAVSPAWKPCIRYLQQGHGHDMSTAWQPCNHCSAPRKVAMEQHSIAPCHRGPGSPYTTKETAPAAEDDHRTGEKCSHLEFDSSPREWHSEKEDAPSPPKVRSPRSQSPALGADCPIQEDGCPSQSTCNVDDGCFEDQGGGRELRKKNPLYEREHPQYHLFRADAHDVPPDSPCHSDGSGRICPPAGQAPHADTVRTNPLQPTEEWKGVRRFIPNGHIDHFQTSTACVCEQNSKYRRLRVPHEGKEHHSAIQRNPIVGLLGPQDVIVPHSKKILPSPAGTFYQDTINYRPKGCCSPPQKIDALTEHRAQYANFKPWVAQDIYSSAAQACKDNKLHGWSVHPSINRFLYEDRNAVVG